MDGEESDKIKEMVEEMVKEVDKEHWYSLDRSRSPRLSERNGDEYH